MPAMEWNPSSGRWIKQCITCKSTYYVDADKWDDASKAFQTFFYEYRVKADNRKGLPADDLHPNCKECHSNAAHKRDYNGKTREQMLSEQNGLCAICYNPVTFTDSTAAVDHNHKTRRIRGILCRDCNWGIGSFKDNRTFLIRAVEYLGKHDENN